MKGFAGILVTVVGWTMAAVAAEATPFTAPIGDHGYLASPWTPSTMLGTVNDAQVFFASGPAGPTGVAASVLGESVGAHVFDVAFSAVDRSQLDNPVDELALDLAALTIDTGATRDVPGPTVLALMGAGLAGMGFTLWRRHGGIRS